MDRGLTEDSHEPSQADVAVYEAIKSPVDSNKFPNVSRWQEHIKSFEAEHANLKGDKSKAAELLNFGAAAGGDDDEVDLFGSDEDEVDPEAERVKAERVKQYEERRALVLQPRVL